MLESLFNKVADLLHRFFFLWNLRNFLKYLLRRTSVKHWFCFSNFLGRVFNFLLIFILYIFCFKINLCILQRTILKHCFVCLLGDDFIDFILHWCSNTKLFWTFWQNSQENTCVGAPTQALVLSCKLCKIFHNNFLTRKLRPTASGNDKLNHNGEQERAGYPISMSSLTNLYFFQNFKSLTGTFYHKMRLYKFYILFCFKRQAVYIHDKLKLIFVSCSP